MLKLQSRNMVGEYGHFESLYRKIHETIMSALRADRSPADMLIEPRPAIVYNFEVDGTFTYFVHDLWVHNNSCATALWSYQKWNQRVGEAHQDWVLPMFGFSRNSQNIGGAVPDILDRARKIVGDVKNAERVTQTAQLETIVKFAQRNGYRPVLVVRDGAELSSWVTANFRIMWAP